MWKKLKENLRNTSNSFKEKITHLFHKKKLTLDDIDTLEETLIVSDISVSVTAEIIKQVNQQLKKVKEDSYDLTLLLFDVMKNFLPPASAIPQPPKDHLNVIIFIGVNGSGKTTSIGKLGHFWKNQNYAIEYASCDTFRAAAPEQLKIWAERSNILVHEGLPQQDPASVAYGAIQKAKKNQSNMLLVDTSGRLHNNQNLMEELQKIYNTILKQVSPDQITVLCTLDATTGQNGLKQIQTFNQYVPLDGLILTKIDGTAKGGVILSLWDNLKIPIMALADGEKIDDILDFEPQSFLKAMLGFEQENA